MNLKSILHKIRFVGGVYTLLISMGSCNSNSNSKLVQKLSLPGFSLVSKHPGTKDSLVWSSSFFFQKKTLGLGLYSSPDSTWIEHYQLENSTWNKGSAFKLKNFGQILRAKSYPVLDSFFVQIVSLNYRKGPARNLYFSLLDPIKNVIYSIRFRYYQNYSNLASKYQMEDSLKKHPKIIQELEKISADYALENDKIYKNPSIKDSAIKRWVMLNDRVYEETSIPGKSFQLNSEEFPGDMAPGLRNFKNNDSLFRKNVSISENGQYKVVSTQKGPVFGFNKSQNKGFILWVPDEPDHYIKTVQLRGNHVLFYDSILAPKSKLKPQYEYDLGQKIIKKLK